MLICSIFTVIGQGLLSMAKRHQEAGRDSGDNASQEAEARGLDATRSGTLCSPKGTSCIKRMPLSPYPLAVFVVRS